MTGNPKYQEILKTGKELFWKYGIKRVTIEEICKEAGVSKMTFYKFFPNKIALAKTILEELLNQSWRKFETISNSDKPFSEILEAIFFLKMEAMEDFSKEFINDIYANPKLGLQDYMQELVEKFQEKIKDFYKNAQSEGQIRKEVKIDFIMAYSLQMSTFLTDEKLMTQYASPKEFVLELMNTLFYGIVTGND